MLKNYLYKTIYYFIFSLFVATSATAQTDSNTPNFSFFGSNEANSTANQDGLIDQSPIIESVAFTNTDISDIFQIIRDRTQWSIFPTSEVSRAKISFYAHNITAKTLLDTIIQMAGFVYHKDDNIITVMTYDEYAQFYGLEKRVVPLKYGNADSISTVLKPFLSNKLGKSIVYPETNSIVIFESEANLETVIKIIEQLDIPSDFQTTMKVIDLVYLDAQELATTLQSIFSEQDNNQNSRRTQTTELLQNRPPERITPAESTREDSFLTPRSTVGIFPLNTSNKLIVKASKNDMQEIEKLVEKLDVFIEPITKTYHFTYIDASDIYNDLQNILDIRAGGSNMNRGTSGQNRREGGRPGGLTLVAKTNSILLTGPPSVHRVMESIKNEVDIAATYEAGEIRTYKLDNADIDEVATTIRELLASKQKEEERTGESKFTRTPPGSVPQAPERTNLAPSPTTSEQINFAETEEYVPQIEATVAVSKSTNSIVIRATARQHRELEKLIKELDKRRKQVQIQAMIIEVTTNNDIDFGIELDDFQGDTLAFTSFGLSTVDPVTGARSLIVSPGGTAAVLHPNKVQAIIKAIQGNDNIRIESSPQLLVNDNAVGTIQSIAEQPTRQTNQSQSTTTTSFGQYVSAGTQFFVTPHISEYDYLRVEYQIILNSFSEQAASDLPPPRSTSTIQSEATVPDGSTIIVGGIQASKDSKSVDKIPLIGDIPVLGWLFRNTVIRKEHITSYLFITTKILENENFDDIKEISHKALDEMGKNNNDPNVPKGENARTE